MIVNRRDALKMPHFVLRALTREAEDAGDDRFAGDAKQIAELGASGRDELVIAVLEALWISPAAEKPA